MIIEKIKAVRRNPRKLLKLLTPLTGYDENRKWSRIVMQETCNKLVTSLHPNELSVLEISGNAFQGFDFKEYTSAHYPDYDICHSTLDKQFDLIIAEQVFEHLLWPYRAGKNVVSMLRPGGYFLISTPFLVRVHNYPVDCSRWTETGLKYFLAECGFPLEQIHTDSWGNRRCVNANFGKRWVRYHSRLHSLHNEPDFPYCVWALAQKQQ